MRKTITLMLLVLSSVLSMTKAQSTPPSTATVEEWYVTSVFTSGDESEDVSEPMKVAFNGNDIFFNFPNPITGNTWMKGTRNDQTITFAKGQKVGSYGGSTIYYMGLDEGGLCDITFTYDEAKGIFVLGDMWIALTNSTTSASALGYFSLTLVSKDKPAVGTGQDYQMTGRNVNPYNEEQYEDINEDVKVMIEGDVIAIQGLSAFDPSVWMQGTISDGVATFTKRQEAGKYETTQLYFIGYDGKETDVTFSYDATTGVLVAQQYILCISGDGNTYQMLQNIVLSPKGGDDSSQPQVVTPPSDLDATTYLFTANQMLTDEEGAYSGFEEVKRSVLLGFYNNNSEVYVRGFCSQLPEAWVKGTVSEGLFGDKLVTFASGQYYGQYGLYPLYLGAVNGSQFTDMTFNYDEQTKEFNNDGGCYLILSVIPDSPAPVEQYVTVNLKPDGVTGIAELKRADKLIYHSLSGQRVDNPGKGVFIVNGKKVMR